MSNDDETLSRREVLKLGTSVGIAGALAPALGSSLVMAKADLPQVPRRVLGKTGKSIPILLFGGGVSLDARFDPKLAEALRFGVNYIDAADCYSGGRCEPAVGNFHKRANNRKELWITSKSDDHDPKGFEKTVRASLGHLQTDYIDLYFLHNLKDPKNLNDDLRLVVEKLKKSGAIRHFGFSCHTANVPELLQLAAKTPWVDAVMFRYNFRKYDDKKLNAAIDAAHKANVGLIAMKTQASESSFRPAWKSFEKTGKWTKHQAVLKAVWADDRISAAVSHMDNLKKLRENIAAAVDKSKLGAREVEALKKYAEATRSLSCDGCDHICGPHAEAPVHIADTMRYLMYHEAYDEPRKALALFRALPAAAQDIGRVDFSAARRACPHGIDLVAHMARAHKLFNV